jgi:hypothetical protein
METVSRNFAITYAPLLCGSPHSDGLEALSVHMGADAR